MFCLGVYFGKMTSRDRILAALDHRETDRVPVDFSGHRSSGIAAMVYPDLRRHLGLPPRIVRVYDMVQQLAIVDEDVLDRFNVDTIEMGRGFLTEEKDWKDWILPDGRPCKIPCYIHVEQRGEDWYLLDENGLELAVQKPGFLYFEQTYFPLKDRPFAEDDFSDLEDVLSHTNYLMFLGLYPDKALQFSEKLCDLHLKSLEKWLGAVGPYIDIIVFGDDLGGQTGPLISPQMYKQVIKPYHRKLWHRAKELADVKVMLHCCGGVRELMEDLIDAELDAINPVQINAVGMDPGELKAECGDKITLWGGGCDTRDILPQGSPGQVEAHVKELVRLLHRGGGFVFQQVHNILADVPAENVVAMFDAVNRQ